MQNANAKSMQVMKNVGSYASSLRAEYIDPGFKYGCNPILKVRFGSAKEEKHTNCGFDPPLKPSARISKPRSTTGYHRFMMLLQI